MKKIIYGDDKNIIYENLKFYREKNNITQAQLAAKL